LRRAGVEYVIMSCGGSRESLRRFAHEIMPAFADAPAQVWAGFQPTSYKQMRASRPDRDDPRATSGRKVAGSSTAIEPLNLRCPAKDPQGTKKVRVFHRCLPLASSP